MWLSPSLSLSPSPSLLEKALNRAKSCVAKGEEMLSSKDLGMLIDQRRTQPKRKLSEMLLLQSERFWVFCLSRHGNVSNRTYLLEGAVWATLRQTINKVFLHSADSINNHRLCLASRIALQWCPGPSIALFPARVQVIQIAARAATV